MSGPFPGAGSNPPVGGSGASPSTANPPVGGQPNQNPAQSGTSGTPGSNPPVGGSGTPNQQHPSQQQQQHTPPSDEQGPVARDVYNERVRQEQALRKRVEQLEALQRQREEATLSEQEKLQRRLTEFEQKESTWHAERQSWQLDKAIDGVARDKSIVSTSAVRAIMMAEFSEVIDYDSEGRPTNAPYVVDRVLEKYPFLIQQQQQQPQAPGAGRSAVPPRSAGGSQYTPQQQQPQGQQPRQNQPQGQGATSPNQWKRLSDLTPEEWMSNRRNNQ